MSRIRSSSSIARAALTVAGVSAAKALPHTASVGIGTAAPRACIITMISFASGARSASQSDLPIGSPAASMKVLAMPPPTTSWSTLSESDLRIVSLVETLDPATMATSGRFGLASARVSASISAARSGPAHATFANLATPWVDASARCAVPKASFT
jgi:hypothetical protein